MPATVDDLVRQAGQRLRQGARGSVAVGAVRDGQVAVDADDPGTVFEIGSVTKTFTSLALARLVSRGVLRWDQPLHDLLPRDITVPRRGGQLIELKHLACHTAGLPRLPRGLLLHGLFRSDPYAGCTGEVLLDGLRRTRLRSVPGTRFHYSNLGAGLLGLALARVAQTDYDELVQAEICRPLGMLDTRVVLDGQRTARLAQGHSRRGRPQPRWHLAALAGAGGLHSTVVDLLRLARAQLGEAPSELAAAVHLTHTISHRLTPRSQVHPGWLSAEPRGGGHRVLLHNGRTGGSSSLLALAPGRGTAVVVLSASTRSVDRAGLDLLGQLAERGQGQDDQRVAVA